jgi:hypothetical protein
VAAVLKAASSDNAGLGLRILESLHDTESEADAPVTPVTDVTQVGETNAEAKLDGDMVLRETMAFLADYIAYPSLHAQIAHTLWIAHTHLMEVWESTPRLAFLSPEPGSGKTRALEVTELLVPRPVASVNASPAYLFRRVSSKDGTPTLLFDEVDTVFGPKAKDNEEVRGMLNAGHRRGAMAGRCVIRGKTVETEELPAYCAVALAGLGNLPDTILSRSVIIRMRRRSAAEQVKPFRRRVEEPEGNRLRARLETWTASVRDQLIGVWPAMPAGIADRDADVWEPLLAIADAAGGPWPEMARVAAVTLVTQSKESSPSLGVRLLSDLRDVFGDRKALPTTTILTALCNIEEAPWADLKGYALDARRLANYLKPYGVKSKAYRDGEITVKGYRREDLHDPWLRYLPSPSPSVTSVTTVTDEPSDALEGF